ncbi:MAG: hypothetical protein AAGF89_06860 [Bacteroidota bacterium]
MSTNKKSFFSLSTWRDYLVQVSLIVLSLLAAVGVDRCNQNLRDENRLEEYLVTMQQELEAEKTSNSYNLGDCQKDVEGLRAAMTMIPSEDDGQAAKGLQILGGVLVRGVFRAFEPLTYERMQSSGDLYLIKDLELREALATYTSFRKDYLQGDLMSYDEMVLEAIDRLRAYLDIMCLEQTKFATPIDCITDREGLRKNAAGDLAKLYRLASLRAFHLELSSKTLDPSLEGVNAALGEGIIKDEPIAEEE